MGAMHALRSLRLAWHRADREVLAALALVGLVLAGLGAGLQAVFAEQDAARAGARAAEARELECLARNVYFEARGEPAAGQYAVAEVTMNRKGAARYPDTVCAVVHQKNWDPQRGRFVGAFSWTEFDVLPAPRGEEWARARKVAEEVYFRRAAPRLQGAMYFHASYIRPAWAKEKTQVARIGRHVFYR
jgi:spore germination cell wall hydrolase CwlJ-like protein